jgi:polyisoprenyl-phosphate glycosyltransferase
MLHLSVIVPCYNEEAVLQDAAIKLRNIICGLVESGQLTNSSALYFVDDGSTDDTWQIIETLCASDNVFRGIKLSRNKGHQNALLAGLFTAPGDALISIDADLQDDPDAIGEMIKCYLDGAEIVYGVRKRRDSDSLFKKFTAESYYRVLRALKVDIVFNHADYRLLSRRAIEALREYEEVNLFLRGVIPQLGFKTATVFYDRTERFAGESKYPVVKMLAFAWEGITSFSAVPLRIITVLGLGVSVISFLIGCWAILVKVFGSGVVPGWASTIVPVSFLSGVQLLAIGIIGEYLAKMYVEIKHRPRFFIEKVIGPQEEDEKYEVSARTAPIRAARSEESTGEG